MKATLTSKGQITVPAAIRSALNLHTGDRLDFTVEQGIIKASPVKKTGTLDDLINCLPKSKHSYTVEEMNESIAEAVAASDAGTRY